MLTLYNVVYDNDADDKGALHPNCTEYRLYWRQPIMFQKYKACLTINQTERK